MAATETVTTSRLRLRRITAQDADDVRAMNDDLRVRRYLGMFEPTAAILARWLREPERWVARRIATGEFVGSFGLAASGPDEYELGYRLSPAAWSQGLATEGAAALVHRAFDVLCAQRVWGQTMTVNLASRRVMEKAGLRYVRTFHQDWGDEVLEGSEHGDVEYELCRGTTIA